MPARLSRDAVRVGLLWIEQAVCALADLVRRPVVDVQVPRPTADVDAERPPGERLLEDALPEVAGKEQRVRAILGERGEEPEMGDAHVLRLVDDDEVIGPSRSVSDAARRAA